MSDDLDHKRYVDTPSGQHQLELERVSSKIEMHVRRFCHVGRSFHMDEPTAFDLMHQIVGLDDYEPPAWAPNEEILDE